MVMSMEYANALTVGPASSAVRSIPSGTSTEIELSIL